MRTIIHGLCPTENKPREMHVAIENGALTVFIGPPGTDNGYKIRIVQPSELASLGEFVSKALAGLRGA